MSDRGIIVEALWAAKYGDATFKKLLMDRDPSTHSQYFEEYNKVKGLSVDERCRIHLSLPGGPYGETYIGHSDDGKAFYRDPKNGGAYYLDGHVTQYVSDAFLGTLKRQAP